jgi:hypothetical protein
VINKKTVFVLGAGASCPYGYPSGSELRRLILYNAGSNNGGLLDSYRNFKSNDLDPSKKHTKLQQIKQFIETFKGAVKSIDVFIANNPKFAPVGKYIIAFEIFRAEQESRFREEIQPEKEHLENHDNKKYVRGRAGFHGEDWYSYLFQRITDGLVGKDALPDFSNGNISFITFNYDRSLEYFLYDSLKCLYSEVPEDRITQTLKQLKILHVYGQIAPLKWQNPSDYVDYKPQINESILQNSISNIRTVHEEKENPELTEAKDLLQQADQIFFLGFGYAPENMEVLGLPELIHPRCQVYGTAFNMIKEEVDRLNSGLHSNRARDNNVYTAPKYTQINNVDCLMLLRKYLR